MEACGDENNVNHSTCIRSFGQAQLPECSPRKMLEERREIRCSSGAYIQFELNGTWVSDTVLHTEEDGSMKIEFWYKQAA